MAKEDKLKACRSQFVHDSFLEDYYSLLKKLHSNMNFAHAMGEVSQNTAEQLLYGVDAEKDISKKNAFKKFKDDFCDIFFDKLRFCDYPEYKDIYYDVKKKGYSGKSATISIFYAMVYFDILDEKTDCKKLSGGGNLLKFFQLRKNSGEVIVVEEKVYAEEDYSEGFKKYLIKQGYKEYTPSGNPSTVYQYIKGIDTVCDMEGLNWKGIAKNIDDIIKWYDCGGEKEEFGNKGHRSVINALYRYAEFLRFAR